MAQGAPNRFQGKTGYLQLAQLDADFDYVSGKWASVVDAAYGADPTGAQDSSGAFSSAGSSNGSGRVRVLIPSGTYQLASSPTPTGSVTWVIDADVTFTGAGSLPGRQLQWGGPRGPISVQANPSSNAAGEALGLHINISSSFNNSPGSGDYVALSSRVTNDGNSSANLWAAEFVTQADPTSGNHQYRIVELEISGDTSLGTLQTDPFSGTNLRYNGVEVVGIAGTSTLTAGYTLWSNNTGPTGWFGIGIALSKVSNTGIQFRKFVGDGANPFSSSIFDLSSLTLNPQPFVLGNAANDTVIDFKNSVDFAFTLRIDSGTSAAQTSRISLSDRGTTQWRIEKDANNYLNIVEAVDGITLRIRRPADLSGSMTIQTASAHNLYFGANATDYYEISTSGDFAPLASGLNTTATSGFFWIETCAGAPTGTLTPFTNRVPLVYDRTNNKIYIYNGAWKSVALA